MEKEKIIYKQVLLSLLFITITSFGDSLAFKGNVGVNPWEAVCQTVNYITLIKVGTVGIIINAGMIIAEGMIMHKIKITMAIQFLVSLFLGTIVNFFVYVFLSNITLTAYYQHLIMAVIGIMISAFGNGLLMLCNFAPFPYEGMCEQIAIKRNGEFAKTRQIGDIIFIILCLTVSLVFGYNLAIREGTVISMLIYSPIMGVVMKAFGPRIKKILK